MDKEYFIRYDKSYINEDFGFHTQFHDASKSYQDLYVKEYYETKNTSGLTGGGFIELEYAKYKIEINPTINDIVRVIKNSLTESDIQFIEEEDVADVKEQKKLEILL